MARLLLGSANSSMRHSVGDVVVALFVFATVMCGSVSVCGAARQVPALDLVSRLAGGGGRVVTSRVDEADGWAAFNVGSRGFDVQSTEQVVYLQSRITFEFMCSNEQTEGRIRDYTGRSVLQSGCGSGNPIDDCWRCDPNWENNRQNLADCAVGFGSKAVGGQGGQIYIVTDNSDNDTVNPAPGTLRYGVTQAEPLWIIFASDMNLTLKEELIMSSFKTIDGRGFDIHIAGGACLTLEYVTHVIVHGVYIHDCISTGPAVVRSNSTHFGQRGTTDGDAVNIFGSQDIWVDHCYFANCADGLVDVIMGSTDITVSNSYFTDHDKVMLLGAHPNDTMDGNLRVTVAFNHFGANLTQRLPRCRHGFFHVVNNDYTSWGIYAVGGSEAPTINSEGNRYSAPNVSTSKEVTMRIDDGGSDFGSANTWNWTSSGDLFLNGAFFTPSGATNSSFWNSTIYDTQATSFVALPATMVGNMTADAGPISYCQVGGAC